MKVLESWINKADLVIGITYIENGEVKMFKKEFLSSTHFYSEITKMNKNKLNYLRNNL